MPSLIKVLLCVQWETTDLSFLRAYREDSNQTEIQLEKSGTIRESNQASGASKAHYAKCYALKSSILLAGSGVL